MTDKGGSPESPYGDAIDLQNSVDQVAERLRSAITEGRLLPGARLRQREIASQFGVSTTPVREAMQQLVLQGFIAMDRNRGAIVALRSPEEIRELYDIRKVLESLAAVRAAQNLDAETLKELREIQDAMERAHVRKTRVELNNRFHSRFYQAANMPLLTTMIENLRTSVAYYVDVAYDNESVAEDALVDHASILEASQQGDPALISRLVAEHLEHTAVRAIAEAASYSIDR